MKIVNLVAIVRLSFSVSLEILKERIKTTEFAASGAKWLKMRLEPEGYYIAFYKSGKFLVTGATSVEQAREIADRVISVLRGAGISVDIERLVVENIVATETLRLEVPLERLIRSLDPHKSSYEPEQFPGLVYKDWGVTFLLFPNGKLIITGSREVEQTRVAVEKIKEVIRRTRF